MTATPKVFEFTELDIAQTGQRFKSEEERLAFVREWCRANDYEVPATLFPDAPDMLPVWNLADLEHMPKAKWYIQNVLEEGGSSVVFGNPGSGKTAVVASMLWSWLAGLPYWLDPVYALDQRTPLDERKVLYLLLEGREGVGVRFRAWNDMAGLSPTEKDRVLKNFLVMPQSISLWKPKMQLEDPETWTWGLRRLMNVLNELRPQIIVIDTQSRATPGMPENNAEDASVLMDILTRFTKEYGASPILLHHSTKGDKKVMRGSSAFEGAVSSAVLIDKSESSDVRWIVPIKQRNTDLVDKLAFKFTPHQDAFFIEASELPKPGRKPQGEKYLTVLGMTVPDAAAVLGIQPNTVYNQVAKSSLVQISGGRIEKLEAEKVEEL